MYPALQELIHQAESKYLQQDDLNNLQIEIARLRQRTTIYKKLRDQEVTIFQDIADRLIEQSSSDNHLAIENCLHHWLRATRYCGMAMLLNDREFLERHLLEWLTEILAVNQHQNISSKLFNLLTKKLGKVFSDKELEFLTPFLNQANNYLSKSQSLKI